jgi:uncharacterized protein YcaQ
LAVLASHGEPNVTPESIIAPLAAELALMARWLGLRRIRIMPRGDLAAALSGTVPAGD